MLQTIKNISRPFRRLWALKRESWRRTVLAQYFPSKPQIINLLANDICNSKCAMCNIWQQKLDFEISPQELQKILSDPLFSEVRSIGITGGEPTLRTDLAELYRVACETLPQLRDMSIITNAIRDQDVIARIEASWEVLKAHGKGFSMMISVDGYGSVHDKQRGRPGNFESAMRVYEHFKTKNAFPVALACTITKQNVWQVDELLEFMMQKGIYGRFRVAEFINRLYNNDLSEAIRNFDSLERYHLAGFFLKLILHFERNERFQRTYQNIIQMLLGGKRQMGCYYQSKGLVLDSRGQIQYCAPKGQSLGSLLQTQGYQLYRQSLKQRRQIVQDNCQDCIHDYHYDETYEERKQLYKKALVHRLLRPENLSQRAKKLARWPFWKQSFKQNQVLITGWYGTETVGDKAILAGIMSHYRQTLGPQVEFVISAIYPFVTQQTLIELGVQAQVVATDSLAFIRAALQCGHTVFGGGPIMGIPALSLPLAAFELAHAAKRQTVIFGCGLGPLDKTEHIAWAKRLLEISSQIKLRDQASIAWAKQHCPEAQTEYSGCPAKNHIQSLIPAKQETAKKPILACFLRDWSKEYQGQLDDASFQNIKQEFEQRLAQEIKDLAANFQLEIHFYCMHTFVVGGDDRIFYRRFIQNHFSEQKVYLETAPSSVEQIVRAMQQASLCLCMRFHSVLFAHTLNARFLALDYTQGGKIRGYLQDHQALQHMVSLQDLAQAKADFSLAKVLDALT